MSDLKKVTQTYNQETRNQLFDDINMRKNYKEDCFGEKKTITDPLTGEVLHKSHAAARNKYQRGSDSTSWTKHASETDHIIPLKMGYDCLKNNPCLSDEAIKKILNAPYNYRETSKFYNISKGAKSDFSMFYKLPPKGKIQIVKDNIKAVSNITVSSAKITADNIVSNIQKENNFLAETSIFIMSEGVSQLIKVANGEKSFDDAVNDIGNLTKNQIFVNGGQKATETILKNVFSEIPLNTNDPFTSSLLSLESILKKSTLEYLNGSINGTQYFQKIGTNGVSLIRNMINSAKNLTQLSSLVAGSFVSPIVISKVCSSIYKLYVDTLQKERMQKENLQRFHAFANYALREMNRQREYLKQTLAEEAKRWDETVEAGFSKIIDCSLQFDPEGVSDGIQEILSLFEKEVRFQKKEDFNDFFMNENSILIF